MVSTAEKFSKGDTLVVELETTQVFDKAVQAYINKEYKIRKPKNNHERLVPMSLSLWEETKKYYSAMRFSTGYTLYLFPTAKGMVSSSYSLGSPAP